MILPRTLHHGVQPSPTTKGLVDWNKLVKPSAQDFKPCRETNNWVDYKEVFMIALEAQNLTHMVDPLCVVIHEDLHEAQQKFLCKVFRDNLLNHEAKSVVKFHAKTKDTALIWQKMCKTCDKSMSTSLNGDAILGWLTSSGLDNGKWNRTQGECITFCESKVKQDEDQEHDSPFDNRGEHKHKEPVRAGVPIENPTGPPSKEPDDIEVNFHSGEIEVNFHADNATRQVHQACQEASILNKTCVHEGEGMPDDEVEPIEEEEGETTEDLEANTPPVETKPEPVDYSKCQRQFLHVPTEKIRRTFAAATQNAASVVHGPKANQTLKSPNPALNIRRRKEAAATDSPFADVPAVDTPGCTGVQMFVGRSSLLTDCYGFCSASEFPNTLLDNIRERGVMDMLTSDHANYEMSARVKDIL